MSGAQSEHVGNALVCNPPRKAQEVVAVYEPKSGRWGTTRRFGHLLEPPRDRRCVYTVLFGGVAETAGVHSSYSNGR